MNINNKPSIALVMALPYEFDNEIIQQCEIVEFLSDKFYIYRDKLIIAFCGVGKSNATRVTTTLINLFRPTHIINLGSACSTNKIVSIFDIHLSQNCQYGDVDVSCDLNYHINQIPYEPKKFYCDEKFNTLIHNHLLILGRSIFSGCAITTDSFVTPKNITNFIEITLDDVYSVDMESAAIGQTCYHYNIPYNSIKIISDKVDDGVVNNHEQYNDNAAIISVMCKQIFDIICELVDCQKII